MNRILCQLRLIQKAMQIHLTERRKHRQIRINQAKEEARRLQERRLLERLNRTR